MSVVVIVPSLFHLTIIVNIYVLVIVMIYNLSISCYYLTDNSHLRTQLCVGSSDPSVFR